MTRNELQRTVIDLAFIEHSEAPFVSCYVPVKSSSPGRLRAVVAPGDNARQIREAFEAIENFLAVGADPRTAGLAVFARRGRRPCLPHCTHAYLRNADR